MVLKVIPARYVRHLLCNLRKSYIEIRIEYVVLLIISEDMLKKNF